MDPELIQRRRWAILAVLVISVFLVVVDNTIVNVALPTLSRELDADTSQLQWIVDSYSLVFAGLLLAFGSLGDRFGRKGAIQLGLVLFGITSALAAVSGSPSQLIAARGAMGVGAALVFPCTLAILTNVFTDPVERAKAIGAWSAVSGLAVALGPVSGGYLLEHFWWGSIFLVNIPVVIAGLIFGYRYIPESKDPNPSKADPLGALLSIAALGVLLAAVIEAPAHGWTSPEILAGFATGIALFVGFMVWEMRCDHPMLNLEFFKNPRFSAASGAITLTFLGLFGMIFLLTQYLQSVLGYSTIKAGAVLLPQAVVIMIAAPLSSIWVNRLGNKVVVAGGLTVCGLAFLTFTQLTVTTPMVPVILLTCLLGLGMGNVMAPATDSIMGSLPRAKAGVGSAMNDTTRQTGGAVGVAVLGSLLSSRYAPEMTAKLTGKVPEQFIQPLTDSIGKTLGIAEKAPSAVRPLIESAARESFVSGMHLASIVAAGILFVAALSVVKWLPARALDDERSIMAPPGEPIGTGAGLRVPAVEP